MPISDDEIIRRRLLMDGDGGSDDKRINSLIKMFMKWCDTPSSDVEQSDALYQRLMSTLSHCDYIVEKSVLVNEMNLAEQANYTALNNDIESKINEAAMVISDAKEELLRAKQIRKNKQEYDSLARVIEEQPDRKESRRKLDNLQKELDNQQVKKQTLDSKLEMRSKQFSLLVSALHEMKDLLKEDESMEKMDTDS